jgi:hypothetical protein
MQVAQQTQVGLTVHMRHKASLDLYSVSTTIRHSVVFGVFSNLWKSFARSETQNGLLTSCRRRQRRLFGEARAVDFRFLLKIPFY